MVMQCLNTLMEDDRIELCHLILIYKIAWHYKEPRKVWVRRLSKYIKPSLCNSGVLKVENNENDVHDGVSVPLDEDPNDIYVELHVKLLIVGILQRTGVHYMWSTKSWSWWKFVFVNYLILSSTIGIIFTSAKWMNDCYEDKFKSKATN